MDTQAMTFGGKSTPSDIEAQRAKIPDVKPKEINLISDTLKKELKDIIHEVLDERECIFFLGCDCVVLTFCAPP